MSQIVVDTDVASYIFNWHSSAKAYVEALRGHDLILSFMTVAELRMGATVAGWGSRKCALLEQFVNGFGVVYSDDALCTLWAKNPRRRSKFRTVPEPSGCLDCGDGTRFGGSTSDEQPPGL
jgi:predicted nucleic acid-binding protein